MQTAVQRGLGLTNYIPKAPSRRWLPGLGQLSLYPAIAP